MHWRSGAHVRRDGEAPVEAPPPRLPVPAAGPLGRARTFLEMIRFSHTVFALPFALTAMLLPRRGLPGGREAAWILAAMIGARTAAMAFNRLADQALDARNPRTAGRALPAGTLSRAWVGGALLLSIGLFVLAAASLNRLCLLLAGPTLVVLLGYSLTKRFTVLCHFALGLALGISPVGAYLGVAGAFDAGSVAAAVLGGAVVLWVAGFDVIYACQDLDHDRAEGLRSIPAALGIPRALGIARALHAAAAGALFAFGVLAGLGAPFFVAMGAVAALLLVEHRLVRPGDLSRMDLAFFRINAGVAILVLAGTAASLYL
jgi:4-hydroxybenzoate polyprenyltransferase